jgi:hypothetical protein
MSIRLLALELYRLEREVDALEKAVAVAAPAERDDLEWRLRQLKAERGQMRGRLAARKETPVRRVF